LYRGGVGTMGCWWQKTVFSGKQWTHRGPKSRETKNTGGKVTGARTKGKEHRTEAKPKKSALRSYVRKTAGTHLPRAQKRH